MSQDPFRLDGRVAIVTGAGGGLGEGICASLAAAGAAVVCADLNADAAEARATAIRNLMDGAPLIAAIKALLAHIHADPTWARVMPPLSGLSAADRATIVAGYDRIREASRAA